MRKITFLPLVVALGGRVAQADGMLDPSFGNGGLVTTNFPFRSESDSASAVVVLPDGRAVAAGSVGDVDAPAMGAARYLTSGALDTTFSGDGRAIVEAADCQSSGFGGGASALLLQPDGRVVLVGECPDGDFLVARLNVDGSPDSSFGTNGHVITPISPAARARAAMLQPDGRIVAVGIAPILPCCGDTLLVAARYNPDGSLDPSFGTGGTLTLHPTSFFRPQDAVLQADGKLVIAGNFGLPNFNFALVRLLPNGTLDTSFGGDGVVTTGFGGDSSANSVIVLGDGRIVAGGSSDGDLALARYLPDGSLDVTFGTGGLVTADSGASETLGQLIVLPNGKLLAAGFTFNSQGDPADFLLARFHPDGALDTSFGSSGFITTDFNAGSSDACNSVALAGPDLFLTAGSTVPPPLGDFALARYIASTPVELLAFEVE